MSESRAAHRYALALLGVADELCQFDAVSEDFEMLSRAIAGSPELVRLLKSPVINKAKKRIVLDEILKGKVTETTYRFIELITSKERETILPEIIRQYAALRDKHLGILRATVRSAVPLSGLQHDNLVKHLSGVTGKTVVLSGTVDPSLVGGFSVQFADTVWDGSVKRQLELLREQFETVAVS